MWGVFISTGTLFLPNNGTKYTIVLNKTHLIPKRKFCTEDIKYQSKFTMRMVRKTNIPHRQIDYKKKITDSFLPGKTLIRFESTTKSLTFKSLIAYDTAYGPIPRDSIVTIMKETTKLPPTY